MQKTKSKAQQGLQVLTLAALILGLCLSGAHSQSLEPALSPEGVHLSLSRFEQLFRGASERHAGARWRSPELEIDLSGAEQRAEVWVSFTAQLDLSELPEGQLEGRIDLVPSAVQSLSLRRGETPLTTEVEGSFHQLSFTTSERVALEAQQITLRYPVRLSRSEGGELSGLLPLPPVSSARLRLKALGRARLIPSLSGGGAQLIERAELRGALALLIPAPESGALLQRKDLEVTLLDSGEGADVQVKLESLVRGSATQAWVPIAPATDALLSATVDQREAITDVKGAWHVVWLNGAGAHVIEARLRVKVDRSSGQPRLSLSPQAAPRSHLSLTLPGERELVTEPPVPLITEHKSLSAEGGSGGPEGESALKQTLIQAELPPLEQLTLRWTEKRVTLEEEAPEFLSETYQLFSLQEGLLKGQAQLEFDVIKGELKQLDVEVPREVVLYHVSGAGLESWVTLASGPDAPPSAHKTVRVSFGEARQGRGSLSLKWQRVLSNNEALEMPLIRPLNAFQESGVIALFDGDRVGFTPAQATPTSAGDERLIPVGQESVPQRILQLKRGEKVSQAFRHVQAPTALKTSTTTERARELRFDAQLDTLYSLRDGAVRAQSQLLLNLKSGRLEALTLSLPASCSEPQVSGPSINRVEPLAATEGEQAGFKRYLVKFTRRLEGAITLNIDAEQLITSESSSLSLPRLIIEGAELTQGHIGLSAEAGLELSPTSMKELRRVAIEELPRAVSLRASSELLYGYRFSRDWQLEAGLKRHKIIETLNAEATSLELQSYLLESGQRVDLARYTIENQDRRTVKLGLPVGSKIQEVLVNEVAVKARAEGDQISVPIPKNQLSTLLVRYELQSDAEGSGAHVLSAPSSDLRTRDVSWDVFFSGELQLWGWSGELKERAAYSAQVDPKWGFRSLTQSVRFDYDLLSAERAPLELKLSFKTKLPRSVTEPLQWLFLLALVMIGLRRGSQALSSDSQALKLLERLALGGVGAHCAVLLYQGGDLTLGQTLKIATAVIVMVSVAVGGVIWLSRKLSARAARAAQPELSDDEAGS